MSKSKIIKQLKIKHPNLTKIQLEAVLKTFNEFISKNLIDGKTVELRSFGSFFTKTVSSKKNARNPKTGESIYVPRKNKVRFRASKQLKKFINNN